MGSKRETTKLNQAEKFWFFIGLILDEEKKSRYFSRVVNFDKELLCGPYNVSTKFDHN